MKKKQKKSSQKSTTTNRSRVVCPEYMVNFSCTGSACADSCCAGWTVSIDKSTYRKYKEYRGSNEQLKKLFDDNVIPVVQNRNTGNYGRIKMDESNACPFLNEDSLCQIQLAQGHSALSDTCTIYPRALHKINGELEYSGTLSCPVLADSALLDKEGLRIITTTLNLPKNLLPIIAEYRSKVPSPLVQKYFFDLQFSAINILQYREISLEKRLILLGDFSEKVLITAAGERELLQKIIDKYNQAIYLDVFLENRPKVEPNHWEQIHVAKLWCMGNSKYSDISRQALYAILGEQPKEGEEVRKDEILARYREGIEKYHELMKTKSYILENYITNTLFHERYPIIVHHHPGVRTHIALSHFLISLKFILIRTTLIGLLIKGEEITDEYMASLIQLFVKRFHHNFSVKDEFIEFYRNEEEHSFETDSLLIL